MVIVTTHDRPGRSHIWEVTHVSEEELGTTVGCMGEGVDFLTELLELEG